MVSKKIYTKYFILSFFLTIAQFIMGQNVTVKGKITDVNNNAIYGANVVILELYKGVYTNNEGSYEIANLKLKEYFLQISYVGYQTITKKIRLEQNETILNVILNRASNELDEVFISAANRRLENLQKTAASISAINSKEISQLQIKQISEINSIAPNFRFYDDGSTGGFSKISSRGITTIDNRPVVGVYVDDIPYFNGFSFPLGLQDVESIEILRGPQGTLYGRNSLAGVIKIKTKKPTNTLSGYLSAGYGNLNAKEFSFALNAPLVENKLFFRASTNIVDRDGFIHNEFNGKDLQNRKIVDFNFRLKYLATNNLNLNLQYNVQRKESNAYALVVGTSKKLLSVLENTPYKANFNVDALREDVTQNISFSAKYDFPSFNISSIFAYQNNDGFGRDDVDYTPSDIQSTVRNLMFNNFSEELRITSTNDSRLQWTTGVFLYHNTTSNNDNLSVGSDIVLINPKGIPNTSTDVAENIQKGISIYGQVTYDVTEKLSLTGGIRFDYEKNSVDIQRTFDIEGFPSAGFIDKAEFDSFSPKVTIGYDVNDDVFAFASVARGYKPGSINNFIFDKEKAKVDPEQSMNYEIGVKSTLLNNRLKMNLTGFYTSYTDQQLFTILNFQAFAFGLDNISKSRIFGVEFENKVALTKTLDIGVNLGYLNAEITNYNEVVANPADGSVTTIDRSGSKLPLSPEFSGNMNVNYIQPISNKLNFESSIDYNYQSDVYFHIPNTAFQPAYSLLNARLGITSKNIDFFIWGKNLSNETYYGYGYGSGLTGVTAFALPRTYGANVTIKF